MRELSRLFKILESELGDRLLISELIFEIELFRGFAGLIFFRDCFDHDGLLFGFLLGFLEVERAPVS